MGNYLKTVDSTWYKPRLSAAMIWVLAAFFLLTVRLFYLQVIEGEELRRLSKNNCIRLQSIDAPRGLCFDRNGVLLVDNRPAFDVNIILKDAVPVAETIDKLSKYIKVPSKELMEKIDRYKGLASYKPILLKRNIDRNTLAAIEVRKFDLPGVIVDVKPRRYYINKQSGSHLLGYLGEINSRQLQNKKYSGCRVGEFVGKVGVEKTYEENLRGNRGGRQVEVNSTGQVRRILKTVGAQPGNNLFLTIDQILQQKAETLLKGLVGAVVAMEPSTGHVLVMASSPSFDPNAFIGGLSHEHWNSLVSNPFRPMENKAVQAVYPPASTYKIVTAIAGLEEGIIDENTTFDCLGSHKYGDRVFRCWKRNGHGKVNVVRALAESCDVFFYQVGQKLGVDRLAWYAKACGLGSRTGIDLDHEARGLVPTKAWKRRRLGMSWQGGETLSVSIGQGYNLATPLQMLVLTSAVANGGTMYRPLILKSIKTAEGVLVRKSEIGISGKLPAGKKTLEIVRKGLWQVVNNRRGTAGIVHVDGIDISGKTGTAQVVSRKKNDMANKKLKANFLKPHAWFVGYAPSDDPEIAVAVIVEHGEHGSSTAGPIARDVIKTYLQKERPVIANR